MSGVELLSPPEMIEQTPLDGLIEITKSILQTKYGDAEFAFLSGSIVRGEGTPFSDLDIIVVYKDLPNAFRESFYFQHFPVEVFVHPPETLNYFMAEDVEEGAPILPNMIAEGIEVPSPNKLSQQLKSLAKKYLTANSSISKEEIDRFRYQLTNLIDDIRTPRSKEYLTASGTEIYAVLADFYFRANGFWSAKNKSIPRVLQKTNPALQKDFCAAFEDLFAAGNSEKVIRLTEEILAPHGGFLFDGLRLDAPAEWKKSIE